MKKILLTGASGFFGQNFLEQKNKKYIIASPTHQELDLVDTKAVDEYFRKHGPFDAVVHAATVGGKRYEKGMSNVVETNLRIFFNIERNKNHYKKMIHFGTGAEYDKSHDIKKIKETDFGRLIPTDGFGFYKYICSKYIESIKNIYHLRVFSLFGRYEDYKVRFISNIICKYLLKLPLTIMRNSYYDFLNIDDFIKIIDYFINEKPKYNFYNVGSGQKITLLSIAKKINSLGDYSLPISIQKSGLNNEYTCDNSRLIKELKNFKFSRIDDAINELYHWYRKNFKRIDKKAIIEDSYNKA
ncbi:NAD-dependent epimerase/dehydratase family protein [Candidatus Roizmanbacteria bacterium]|nr:NAD-dependent epimerase/dehydratase family protein [Candidatus Roizmanbacteria bacterium]